MAYLFYVAIKLLCYSLWCWVGLRWLRQSSSWAGALGFGVVRLLIGLAFGIAIFVFYRASSEDLLLKYLAIYAPVRLLEWFIMAAIIRAKGDMQIVSLRSMLWCVGGVAVSFAADLASPEGVAGHFCVGRCLC